MPQYNRRFVSSVVTVRSAVHLSEEDQRIYQTTLAPYLASPVVQRMASYTQHGNVSTLGHCLNVAKMSLWLNRALRLRADTNTLLAGALLHDFYLYDWHGSGWRHSYRHPEAARRNAVRYFHANDEVQHVIRCHMWPLGLAHVPHTREAILVSVADKCVSLYETLFKRKGVRRSCG